jgi:hypothetical protein
MGPERLCRCKIPLTTSGIEPAAFGLVAKCFNELRHRLTLGIIIIIIIIIIISGYLEIFLRNLRCSEANLTSHLYLTSRLKSYGATPLILHAPSRCGIQSTTRKFQFYSLFNAFSNTNFLASNDRNSNE